MCFIYLVLIKLDQKSQTPYRGRNRACGGFTYVWWGVEWEEEEPVSLPVKENILLLPYASENKKLICLES